jgi:hypothetical protein
LFGFAVTNIFHFAVSHGDGRRRDSLPVRSFLVFSFGCHVEAGSVVSRGVKVVEGENKERGPIYPALTTTLSDIEL